MPVSADKPFGELLDPGLPKPILIEHGLHSEKSEQTPSSLLTSSNC